MNMSVKTTQKNLMSNVLILFSAMAALCLFLSPTRFSLFTTIVSCFVIAKIASSKNKIRPYISSNSFMNLVILIVSLLFLSCGFCVFQERWPHLRPVQIIADILRLKPMVLIRLIAGLGMAVGFYAIYVLSSYLVYLVSHMPTATDTLLVTMITKSLAIWDFLCISPSVRDADAIKANLKRNWFFPISTAAFAILEILPPSEYIIMLHIALWCAIVIASQVTDIWKKCKENSNLLKIFSLLTAIGIVWYGHEFFTFLWGSDVVNTYFRELSLAWHSTEFFRDNPIIHAKYIGFLLSLAAVYSVYTFVLFFWKKTVHLVKEARLFQGIMPIEVLIYLLLFIIAIICVGVAFTETDVFYAQYGFPWNLIYTSDSGDFIEINVFLNVLHRQNDLKQPMFTYFAMPFSGLPYLISRIAPNSQVLEALLINASQIALFLIANFMLAKAMKLSPLKRICFMLFLHSTYTQMLFVLLIEQYIIPYFWFALLILLLCEDKKPERFILWGAGGTLLTNMVIIPFFSKESLLKDFVGWITDMIKYGMQFCVVLVLCRFDVIYNILDCILTVKEFTGASLTFKQCFYQYTEFVRNCFLAPVSEVYVDSFSQITWQLSAITKVNFTGIIVILMAIFSAFLNKDKKIGIVAGYWIGFSFVLLVVMGWGAVENGMILYSLCFSWAFFALMFQLVEWIECKLHISFLLPLVSLSATAVLLSINIPAIVEMIRFSICYYPR